MRSSMLARSGIVSSFSSAKHIKTTSNIRSVSFINDGFGCQVRDDIIQKQLDNEVASSLTIIKSNSEYTVNLLAKNGQIISRAYFSCDTTDPYGISSIVLDHPNKRLNLLLNNGSYKYCSLADLYNSKQDVITDLQEIRRGAALGATAVQPSALLEYRKSVDQDVIDNQIKADLQTEKDRAAAAESLLSRQASAEKKAREDADAAIIQRLVAIEQQYVIRSSATQNNLSIEDINGETHSVSAEMEQDGSLYITFG